jgi:hypothetical protein
VPVADCRLGGAGGLPARLELRRADSGRTFQQR